MIKQLLTATSYRFPQSIRHRLDLVVGQARGIEGQDAVVNARCADVDARVAFHQLTRQIQSFVRLRECEMENRDGALVVDADIAVRQIANGVRQVLQALRPAGVSRLVAFGNEFFQRDHEARDLLFPHFARSPNPVLRRARQDGFVDQRGRGRPQVKMHIHV